MPTETRLALAYRFKEFETERAKERMQVTQFKTVDDTASKLVYTPQLDNATPENTEKGRALEAIAKRAGVSHMTAFQYDKIQQQGTEEQKAEVVLQEKIISNNNQDRFIINKIIEAEARASLVDVKIFTREAAAILKKGSKKFINKLIE